MKRILKISSWWSIICSAIARNSLVILQDAVDTCWSASLKNISRIAHDSCVCLLLQQPVFAEQPKSRKAMMLDLMHDHISFTCCKMTFHSHVQERKLTCAPRTHRSSQRWAEVCGKWRKKDERSCAPFTQGARQATHFSVNWYELWEVPWFLKMQLQWS